LDAFIIYNAINDHACHNKTQIKSVVKPPGLELLRFHNQTMKYCLAERDGCMTKRGKFPRSYEVILNDRKQFKQI